MPELNITIKKEKFLLCYQHLISSSSEFFDIDFLYGGRDSGKSRHIAQQLIVDCMREKYFKCLLIRKVLNTVRDSQYNLIKSIIEEWNIQHLFLFNDTRLEIRCKANGNGFFGRGLDDVGRIKSFANPSHCWIEEGNQIDNTDFVVILTSLRANQRVKTWFSFNPECEMTYTEFWLWQEWFLHTDKLSWTWTKTVEVDGEQVEFKARATHTTYRDNPYCKPQRKALYESYKGSKNNAYWYQTYTLGLWGYRRTGGEFWKCFEEAKHTAVIPIGKRSIHVSLDNNVHPYVTVSCWQIDLVNKKLLQVFEIPCESPDNTAAKAARRLAHWLKRIGNVDIVYLYGDPSANNKSTVDDNGRSFFDKFKATLIEEEIKFNDRIQRSHPEVALSGSFIDEIYEANYLGWSIAIDNKCRKSIEDYTMTKENKDGGVLKKRETDKETKISFEKYGHFSDAKRYFMTTVLASEFEQYKSRFKRMGSKAA
jgi:phage terminase large subunit